MPRAAIIANDCAGPKPVYCTATTDGIALQTERHNACLSRSVATLWRLYEPSGARMYSSATSRRWYCDSPDATATLPGPRLTMEVANDCGRSWEPVKASLITATRSGLSPVREDISITGHSQWHLGAVKASSTTLPVNRRISSNPWPEPRRARFARELSPSVRACLAAERLLEERTWLPMCAVDSQGEQVLSARV